MLVGYIARLEALRFEADLWLLVSFALGRFVALIMAAKMQNLDIFVAFACLWLASG